MTTTRNAVATLALRAAVLALLLPAGLATAPAPASGQATLTEGDGAVALGVALRRLGNTKRVLMIGAHPDDENTALLAELALGDGADVAYLSLTRGEGGQNLIGPELQEALGIIRTEELLAARRLDGARQFFSRAYDFGFSKSAEETLRHWPRDSIVGDVVEVIRRYRPDIVVSIFSGTPADGHGHHQAAGIIAREAFDAAGDPARFPAHAARGLAPHRAHYLFQSLWRPPPEPPFTLATGTFDPLFGRSRHQIAMQSRSRHRSQDMGQAETPGPQRTALTLIAGDYPAGGRSLFAGLDTTLSQRARSAGALDAHIRLLELYEARAQAVQDSFNPLRPQQTRLRLGDMHQRLVMRVAATDSPTALEDLLADELRKLESASALASGFVLDATADTPLPVAGESFMLTISIWNGESQGSPLLERLEPLLPDGWTFTAEDGEFHPRRMEENELVRRRFRISVPASAEPTQPYFLRTERPGSWYAWQVDDAFRGMPFEPRPVRAVATLGFLSMSTLERDAEFVTIDKSIGELREPLRVVPPVSVSVEPRTLALPSDDARSRVITVTVSSASAQPVEGVLRLLEPDGFRVEPSQVTVRLDGAGDTRSIRFTVTPPAQPRGMASFEARFATNRGTFDRGYVTIDYPHIRSHSLYREADVLLSAFPVAIAPDLRVGYIEGAGDDGADALRQIGATVEPIDAAMLAAGDLSRFDAIVAGIRAYEVRPDILAHNDRLLEFARRGGTVVIQYNKYEIVEGGFMPYPATMSRPHGRVTDEAAPVTILAPEHPLMAGPNRITATDFDGWVQERGLYFLATFDERYTPLLAMADAGEEPLDGSLVAARVGDGWYIYTGLALFRQLPEGVPGAYRLLANMVSLGRAR
jgi:LmbE family N-acetylglucosaminyl deacetylase